MFYSFLSKIKPVSKVLLPAAGVGLAANYYDIEANAARAMWNKTNGNNESLVSRSATPTAKRQHVNNDVKAMLDDWGDWASTLFSGSIGYVYKEGPDRQPRIEGSTLKLRWTYVDSVYYQKVVAYLQKTPAFVDDLDISLNGLSKKNSYALERIFDAFPLTLRTVSLGSNGFGEVPGSVLAAALQANRAPLTRINLDNNDFNKYKGADMQLALSALPESTEILDLGSNHFDEMPINDLVLGLSGIKHKLRYLGFMYNNLGKFNRADLCALAASFKAKHVNLSHNDLYKLAPADFAAMIANLSDDVEVLDLTFNGAVFGHFSNYTIEDWLQIAAAIKPTLKKVILHGNHLGLSLKPDDVLRLVEALGDKLEELDISYNSLHDNNSPEFYLKLLKAANKFKHVTMDYFSMLEFYKPSPKNDALVLEMMKNLPKGETRLGWFWLNGQGLSKLPFKLLLQVIENAPAHITELSMQGAGYYLNESNSTCPRFTVKEWQEILAAAPETITEVDFYNCCLVSIFYSERALADILSSLKPNVQHIGLGYNDLEIYKPYVMRALKNAFAVLKPTVQSVDLRVNSFGKVSMTDFIDLLHAVPNTLETVYFPDDMQKYAYWNQNDLEQLFAQFPELNCEGAVAKVWKRPKQLQLENSVKPNCRI